MDGLTRSVVPKALMRPNNDIHKSLYTRENISPSPSKRFCNKVKYLNKLSISSIFYVFG